MSPSHVATVLGEVKADEYRGEVMIAWAAKIRLHDGRCRIAYHAGDYGSAEDALPAGAKIAVYYDPHRKTWWIEQG